MKLIHSNWNKDPERILLKEANDCTVQAMCSALNIPYSEGHSILKSNGRKNRRGFVFGPFLERMDIPGITIERVNHDELRWHDTDPGAVSRYNDRRCWRRSYGYTEPSVEKYVTAAKFAATHQTGTYFLMSRGHVQVLKDGALVDSKPSPRAKITHAYRMIDAREHKSS